MTEKLVTDKSVGVRDGLILDTINRLMQGTGGDEIDAVAHAALSYSVLAKLVGLDDIDDLINQIADDADRIVERIEDYRRFRPGDEDQ